MSQQLVMTPQLQQAIKLLQLSHLEIAKVLREEIEQNPVLEENGEHGDASVPDFDPTGDNNEHHDESRDDSINTAASPDEVAYNTEMPRPPGAPFEATSEIHDLRVDSDIDWESYVSSSSYSLAVGSGSGSSSHDAPPLEATLTKPTSLIEHMRWQVRMAALAPFEQQIAWRLVEELNEDGYLSPDAVAMVQQEANCDKATVEAVLYVLQEFDPPGVAARNVRECLLLQTRHIAGDPTLPQRIIEDYLPYVERRNLPGIARELKVSLNEVTQAVHLITLLEPRPGSIFSTREPQYITPDIYVHKIGPDPGDYAVTLNEDGIPRLRISPYYKDAIQDKIKGEAKSYIQEKLRSAAWLIRSIHMRQRTIYKVMASILKFQHAFFEQGVTALKPLILKDVADDVEMHESTISRVTTNKYVHTPLGIYELKYFFNSSIKGIEGDNVASESVRNHIERLIGSENSRAPYSDQRIVELLKAQDINIARRTVAKYREMLKVPSSSRRKRVF